MDLIQTHVPISWGSMRRPTTRTLVFMVLLSLLMGCRISNPNHPNHGMAMSPGVFQSMPSELSKTTMPDYVIEPPDVVAIEAVHLVPKAPYHLKQLDSISIESPYALPDAPIAGDYVVEPSGLVQLGSYYGAVSVVGLTVEEAHAAIESRLATLLRNPTVQVRLGAFRAAATVSGTYRVGPDGSIRIGGYGGVRLVGKTVSEAKVAIEDLLSTRLDDPVISVHVASYESKGVYVVVQGGGIGDSVVKVPSTGNETVLDALATIEGLQPHSSKRIWVTRPNSSDTPTVMPVDYFAITERGVTTTNYQLLPGDRVFVAADAMVSKEVGLAKLVSPFERMFGFTLLGVGTGSRLTGSVLGGGGNPNNIGF